MNITTEGIFDKNGNPVKLNKSELRRWGQLLIHRLDEEAHEIMCEEAEREYLNLCVPRSLACVCESRQIAHL